MTANTHKPSEQTEKERYVERLFASIAPRYDLLNSVISFGRHGAWRRFAVKMAGLKPGDAALDVAAGTGDLSFEMARAVGSSGTVTAVDFCEPMVEIGARKAVTLHCSQHICSDNTAHTRHSERSEESTHLSLLSSMIRFFASFSMTTRCVPRVMRAVGGVNWVIGGAADLPFRDDVFDCAAIAFGLRNLGDVSRAISEMTRVIKPGGRVITLEIVRPTSALVKPFWALYFLVAMPLIARVFGGKREAYTYLPESVKRFYTRQELSRVMTDAGLKDVRFYDLTGGVVSVHVGVKP